MTEAYFATRTYRAQSSDLADERLVNAYLERSPEGAKSQVPVIGSPGITEFDSVGDGPIWGIHKAALGLGERLYVVSDDDLYSVDENAVATLLGTVMGRRRVHMSSNAAQLIIVNGLHHYVYDTTDGLQKLKFGLGMDGDFEITHDGTGAASVSMTITITGGPASAADVNEIIVSITGDSSGQTYFTDRPSDADTISQVATDLAATIDADADYTASAVANTITVTPSGANSFLTDATTVATSYHHTIEIGDSFETDDFITLTFELVGLSDVTVSHLVTSSDTPSTIASALNTLIDAESTLTSTVLDNVITAFGQTPGTHVLTDIYSTQDWAVISGQAPYAKQVWALDGFFIYPVTNTPSFRISSLNDGSRIDLLDVESLSTAHSNIMGICVNQREINVLGENYGEIYRNTGAADFPFTRIPGAHIERGCAATYSIAKGESTWAWLGSDRRVYAMSGYTPQRISTHGIEHKIEGYTKVDDAFSFVTTWKGHVWYVLTFPSEDQTWMYDSTTNEWHERVTSFLDAAGGGTDYTIPDLEQAQIGYCGAGWGLLWIDRPHDPGVFICANASSDEDGGQGNGNQAILLSHDGKNWRAYPNDNIDEASPARTTVLGYSRAMDQILFVANFDSSEDIAESLNGGLSWSTGLHTGVTSYSILRVDKWDKWLFGNKSSGNVAQISYSATGASGSWTAVDVSTSLSFAASNGVNTLAYSPSLDLAVAASVFNGMGWSTNGTSWSDADTFPSTSATWNVVLWASGISKFVAMGTSSTHSRYAVSSNGKDWTDGDLSTECANGDGLAYSPSLGLIVAATLDISGGHPRVFTSTNGTTWTEKTASATLLESMAYNAAVEWSPDKEIFVMGGKDGDTDGILLWSEDADTWTRATEDYA